MANENGRNTSSRNTNSRNTSTVSNKRKVIFVPNVNDVIEKKLHETSTAAIFKSLVDCVNNRYVTIFSRNMQDYVQRLGRIISSVSTNYKMQCKTYLGAVDFIGSILPKRYNVRQMLRGVGVNNAGNDVKHETKNVDVDMKECVHQYNRMLSIIIKELGLTALKICYIQFNFKKENYRDTALFDEKYDVKHEVVGGIKMSIAMSKEFTLDQYDKTLHTTVMIDWKNSENNYAFNCIVRESNTNTLLSKVHDIKLFNTGDFAIEIIANESMLDRRKLSLDVEIETIKYENEHYTTGALFWKKDHSHQNTIPVDTKTVQLSHIY